MRGDIVNNGKITGATNGIYIGPGLSGLNITNSETGNITGTTGIYTKSGLGLDNTGVIKGTNGDGIHSESGDAKITNTSTISGTRYGIYASNTTKMDIISSGIISGKEAAIFFNSASINTLTLDTGSELVGNVVSAVSKENTITLIGSGSEDSSFIGLEEDDGFASLTMKGKDWSLTGDVDLIGTGETLLVNSGKLTLGGNVANSGSTHIQQNATLQLGDGQKKASLTGKVINEGTFIFNQGENSTYSGDITGSGNVEKTDANVLTLSGNNTYTGNTQLHAGVTLVAEGATLGAEGSNATLTIEDGAAFASAGTVYDNIAILSGGTLAAWNAVAGNSLSTSSTVDTINGNVSNSGTLLIGGQNNAVGNNFIINGDYTGAAGSRIVMNSKPGDDNAPTDRLSIKGSSYGVSDLVVNNVGGMGALTVNGMEVINVGGNSNAEFTLAKPVVAGAWEYNLFQHENGNWYLESKAASSDDDSDSNDGGNSGDDGNGGDSGNGGDGGNGGNGGNGDDDGNGGDGGNSSPEIMAPEVGAYLGNYQAAQGMFLHKRDDRDQLTLRGEDDLNTWLYVKGRYHENDVAGDKLSYDTTSTVLQIGTDFVSKPLDKGILHAGAMAGAGQAKTHSDSKNNARNAQGKVDGFNVGIYATWQEDEKLRLGSYIDTWAAYSWYNNNVSSNRNDEDYNSEGFAASLEAGHAWVIDSERQRTWKIEPQVQVIYSYLDQDNHTDPDGVRVTQLDNDSVFGRLGVKSSYFDRQDVQAWQPYVAVNWLKGAGQNELAFNSESISNDTPEDRGQLELGVTGNLNETTTFSVRISGEWGKNSYDAYGGHILLNHRW
ncbi:adhesin autotransporter [Citrobacter rodentium]|nr:adhesin autotransporter [Citrobacter rodentium]